MGIATGATSPCPKCRSHGRDRTGDNLTLYDNGSAHCFACGYDVQPKHDVEELTGTVDYTSVAKLQSAPLALRGVSQRVSAMYGAKVEYDQDTGEESVYHYPVYKGPKIAAYHSKPACRPGERKGNKDPWYTARNKGDARGSLPFGANITKGAKFIVVTEGAEDCLATQQALIAVKSRPYNVVATLGVDRWRANIEWFLQWEKVVILFDSDPAGEASASEFAEALGHGRAHFATLPDGEDPNSMLESGREHDLVDAIWNCTRYEPAGVYTGEAVWAAMEGYTAPPSIPYPDEWPILNEKLGGIRAGEISMWTAGSGIGKTQFLRRLRQHVISSTDWGVAEIELEGSKERAFRGMLQYQAGVRLADMTREDKRKAWQETYGTGRLVYLDHRGGKGGSLVGKLKFLHYAYGVKLITLDHITLAVNDYGDSLADQDRMMGDYVDFVETTGCHLALVSHIRKPPSGGPSWAKGAVPTEEALKGSGSLYQLPSDIIAISRNKLAEDDYERNTSFLTVLKCRETGRTGQADALWYNDDTTGLEPADLSRLGSDEGGDEDMDIPF